MKVNIVLLLLFFGCTAPMNLVAQVDCVDRTDAFEVGEKLEYDLYFNWTAIWLKAGVVSFKIKDGDVEDTPAMHVVAEARTPRTFDWIFRVRDKYESYLDYNTLNPLRFVRDVHEGDYTKQLQYTYRPEMNEAVVDYMYRKGKLKAENEVMAIPACTQDLLSALYFARSLDFSDMEVGESVAVDLLMDKKMYEVSFKYIGQDTLDFDGNDFRCNKFIPTLIQGDVFEESDEIVLWVTDDANNLPLFVESQLSFGKIKVFLKKHKGLRHPLTSVVR